ncbi:MAG TPA: porin [Verrucomicrobiae bacterium]
MRLKKLAVVTAIGISATGIQAQTDQSDQATLIKQLIQRIEELEQKVKIQDRKLEIDKEASAEKAKTTPVVSLGASGFSVRSPDTNFVFRLRGYVQADGRYFIDDNVAGGVNDQFLLRRVRPIIEGTAFKNYDYRIMLDFPSNVGVGAANNGLLQDAYVTAKYYPWLNITAGKFKEPVGLERLQSGANLLFNERAYPTQLLPNRDLGIQLSGTVLDNRLEYALGIFNGVANGGSGDADAADDDKDLAARLFATPFINSDNEWIQGLGFGVAGTVGNNKTALRGHQSPGQQTAFAYNAGVVGDGELWRISPQAYYYKGSFGAIAEYAIAHQSIRTAANTVNTLNHSGWQVAASYFLTGEKNSFKAVSPAQPFTVGSEGWGAFELSARVSGLDLDDESFPTFANANTSATEALSWAVGVNCHLNRFLKLSLSYEQTDFDTQGNAPSPLLDKGEKVVFSRVQFSF